MKCSFRLRSIKTNEVPPPPPPQVFGAFWKYDYPNRPYLYIFYDQNYCLE